MLVMSGKLTKLILWNNLTQGFLPQLYMIFGHGWLFTRPGPRFNIKMISYQHRKSHCRDKTILRPSYLHNGISYTGKMTSLYWIRAMVLCGCNYLSMFEGQCWFSSARKSSPSSTPGPRLNIKTVLSTYGDFHVKDKTAVRTSYL